MLGAKIVIKERRPCLGPGIDEINPILRDGKLSPVSKVGSIRQVSLFTVAKAPQTTTLQLRVVKCLPIE